MKRDHFRIVSIGGSQEHNWYEPTNCDLVMDAFKTVGITIPTLQSISRKTLSEGDLRVLTANSGHQVSFMFYDRSEDRYDFWEFDFKRGFIWDIASVPKPFRSIVDNDSYAVRLGSIIHDAMFGLKLAPYRYANRVFYHAIRYRKGNALMSSLAFLGVSTPVGARIYRNSVPSESWIADFVVVKKNGVVVWNTGENVTM